MGDLGFWALAHEDPEHLALVDPDGTEFTAAELLARTNQVVHAFRRSNLRPGDVVATLLPNGVEVFELYLACLQAGWYLVPINHHLIAPEVGVHPEGRRRPRSSWPTSGSPTWPSTPPRRPSCRPRSASGWATSSASPPTPGPGTPSRPPIPRTGPSATS